MQTPLGKPQTQIQWICRGKSGFQYSKKPKNASYAHKEITKRNRSRAKDVALFSMTEIQDCPFYAEKAQPAIKSFQAQVLQVAKHFHNFSPK